MDEPAEDRPTPDLAIHRFGDSDRGRGGRSAALGVAAARCRLGIFYETPASLVWQTRHNMMHADTGIARDRSAARNPQSPPWATDLA
jgi:hypothetical protein